jgi:hypothetical protein
MADREAGAGQAETGPRPAAVTFVTTEHFTLQGARSSTIAEATGRATMFLGAVSGGLVALGLIATAAGVRTAFYAFALILLPTLVFVGLATFNRVLQSGIEDFGYASRIARLRGYYFRYAPELAGYLLSVPPAERLRLQGIGGGRWRKLLTVAAMARLVTAVLAGSGGRAAGGRRLWPRAHRGAHRRRLGRHRGVRRADPLPGLDLAAGGGGPARRRVSGDHRARGRLGPASCRD